MKMREKNERVENYERKKIERVNRFVVWVEKRKIDRSCCERKKMREKKIPRGLF